MKTPAAITQPIPMRIMNLQILVGDQDQAGYEVLPIARIEKSAEAEPSRSSTIRTFRRS